MLLTEIIIIQSEIAYARYVRGPSMVCRVGITTCSTIDGYIAARVKDPPA